MRSTTWSARLLLGSWLVVMWLLLWGQVTVANVGTGALVAAGVVWAFPPAPERDDPLKVRVLPALSLVGWFLWALVVSNVAVAREVVMPASRTQIRPGIVACALRTRSGRLATVIANLITLTPGTLTVEARGRPAVLFVHVLSYEDLASVRADVDDLERRVVRAFGTDEDLAHVLSTPVAQGEP